MNFIDKLILPESIATLNLLSNLLLLGRIFFLAYSGVLLAGTILSVLNIKNQRNNNFKNKLSAEFINLAVHNSLLPIGLGIVPLLGTILIIPQMLYQTQNTIIQYLMISFVLYILSLIFLYFYRSRLNKSTNNRALNNSNETNESQPNIFQVGNFPVIAGWISSILMIISLALYSAVFSSLEDVSTWSLSSSLPQLFSSFNLIVHFLKYLFFAFSFTAILMIFKFQLQQKQEKSVNDYYHSIALKSWIVVLVLCFTNIFSFPTSSLSMSTINLTILTALIMIIQIQLMIDNSTRLEYKKSIYIFINAIILFSLINIIDHTAFVIASDKQLYVLGTNYENAEEEYKKTHLVETKINGKEIYTSKCMACHRFDQKLVGPPHKQILLKYASNKEAMIQFILNPVKVDPAYPNMPQQGLTPSEAKAVVEFMYQEYGEQLK